MPAAAAPLRTRRLGALTLAVVASASLAVAGCSSDGESKKTGSTPAPEEIVVSDAKVATGLAAMKALFGQAAAAIEGGTPASAFPARIEDQWKQIEGTVKQNASGSYIDAEDALAAVNQAVDAKDASAATRASTDFASVADAYLAAHP